MQRQQPCKCIRERKKSNYGRVYLFLYLKIPINQIKHFIMQKKIPIYELY